MAALPVERHTIRVTDTEGRALLAFVTTLHDELLRRLDGAAPEAVESAERWLTEHRFSCEDRFERRHEVALREAVAFAATAECRDFRSWQEKFEEEKIRLTMLPRGYFKGANV